MTPYLRLLLFGLALSLSACTSVTDLWENEVLDGGHSDVTGNDLPVDATPKDLGADTTLDPCDDEQNAACASQNKKCAGGFCSDCLDGYEWDNNGQCVQGACPGLDCAGLNRECDAENNQCGDCLAGFGVDANGNCVAGQCGPNTCVKQFCEDGFCLDCLPGYYEDEDGICREPNPCAPNPCTKPFQSACSISPEDQSQAVCSCTGGSTQNENGDCIFDPCANNPCDGQPKSQCIFNFTAQYECVCPDGTVGLDDNCVNDPCSPNPCDGFAQTSCKATDDTYECKCDLGFAPDESGACIEARIENAKAFPASDEPLTLGLGWSLFADDSLIEERSDFVRKIHPIEVADEEGWSVLPDPENGQIVQARAAGSLINVPFSVRKKLPNGHPLKPYSWRLYYMGYRQTLAGDAQPAWLCIAAASNPEGPWVKPILDPGSPQTNCTLRIDGLFQTEVTLRDGMWTLSATRLGMGEAQPSPGIHVYESVHGIFWEPPAGIGGAVIGMNVAPQEPAKYGRASHLSRLVYDDKHDRFVAYIGLLSNALGNARGVYFGESSPQPQAGWTILPSPVEAPGILGPKEDELIGGIVYGDMVVWREGGTYFGLVQKEVMECQPNEVLLATSSDQRHWVPVVDEELMAPVPVLTPPLTNHFTEINSLTGGRPAATNNQWHFFFGGTQHMEGCPDQAPAGGIMRGTARVGGLVGLVADANTQATLVTRKFVLTEGLKAQELRVNAKVSDKLVVTLERLSPIGTKLVAMQKVVAQGDYPDHQINFGINDSVDEATSGVFQLSFMFTGGGELFGFNLGDPLCTPNPCVDVPGKTTCSSVGGEPVCVCDAPLHDDGEGNCTDDPCQPEPCTMPNQSACEVVDGQAVCGCEDGWIPFSAVCVADPCQPSQDSSGNTVPAPCLPLACKAPNGAPVCYCPEGSTEELTGCVETDMRAFVTTMSYTALEIGGLAAAHSLCTAEALNNGLVGSYAAWLSTPDSNAYSKFLESGPWRTYDPKLELWVQLVANDISDLIDGSIHAPIDHTAAGLPKEGECAVWTGTTPKGQATPPVGNLGGSCGQWSSDNPGSMAMAGQCSKSNEAWTAAGPRSCNEKLALYCLQVF